MCAVREGGVEMAQCWVAEVRENTEQTRFDGGMSEETPCSHIGEILPNTLEEAEYLRPNSIGGFQGKGNGMAVGATRCN
jgi:hypothetical protein